LISAYQLVTDKIIELLEKGTIPWHKPWKPGMEPTNFVTGRHYKGINRFLLSVFGYKSPYWLTFRQANQLGGRIKGGEKSLPVVFWKWIEVEIRETGKIEERPLLKHYRVFNAEQITGIDFPDLNIEQIDFTPIERCELILSRMRDPPKVEHNMQSAWYSPDRDIINMPKRETFERAEGYYSTLFHELSHSTGHKDRLDRPSLTAKAKFGSTKYGKEELVAEMGSTFLCSEAGIENITIENSAAYIEGWIKRLRKDSSIVVQSASQAQRSTEYILGT
jgi:antirestriction protein ArdC